MITINDPEPDGIYATSYEGRLVELPVAVLDVLVRFAKEHDDGDRPIVTDYLGLAEDALERAQHAFYEDPRPTAWEAR